MPYTEELCRLVDSFFIRFTSLSLISVQIIRSCIQGGTPSGKIAQEPFALVKNMDNRLRHLKLDYNHGMAIFYLRDS